MITVTDSFRTTFPGARLGVLAMTGVINPPSHAGLEEHKVQVEEELRRRYAGFDRPRFKELSAIRAYDAYYKKFDKSYHVLLQLESVALKGKPIPRVAALVESMFMAELKNMLLTAGHDWDKLVQPLTLDVSAGGETFTGIRGKEETLYPGDMFIRDDGGIISSVVYGPDARTCITADTRNVLFTVYAPEGIGEEAVRAHLLDIETYVHLVSVEAKTLTAAVL